jgi:uncharacterized protein (DUF58 family)
MSDLRSSMRLAEWFSRRHGIEEGDVALGHHRIYILPTRTGMVFWLVIAVLLIGSINFGLQLGYLLTFTIVGMALVSLYQTHRNLSGLVLRGQAVAPVHAGDVVGFELTVSNPVLTDRYAMNFAFMLPSRRWRVPKKAHEDPMPGTWVDLPAGSTQRVRVALPTRRRGLRQCPRIRLSTRFPFGLWEAWAYFQPALATVVYPRPETDAPPLPQGLSGHGETSATIAGGDEFSGVRPYRPGDPQKMIAWRLAARSDDLTVRFFESNAAADVVLDMNSLPSSLSVEQRIARLARWVLMAEAGTASYSLTIPGVTIERGRGPVHEARCLKALALLPAPGPDGAGAARPEQGA